MVTIISKRDFSHIDSSSQGGALKSRAIRTIIGFFIVSILFVIRQGLLEVSTRLE